jgi:hypothetical protein
MFARALFLLLTNPIAWHHDTPRASSYTFRIAQGQGPSLPKPRPQGLRVGSQVPLKLAAK